MPGDEPADERHLVVYTTCHEWIQQVVAEVCPPTFRVEFVDLNDEEAAAAMLPQADFIVCLTLDERHARLLERCQLVMHNGVGYDGIAIDVLAEKGIPVALTPAMTPEGVAEHVFMMILALNKQLPAVRDSMSSGEWNMFGWRERSHNLAYKTLGVVGVGRIGSRVARIAHAFGCRVVCTDIVDVSPDLIDSYDMTQMPLDELLETSDVVTMHVPLTDATSKMIGPAEFDRMKPSALFVNASRGPVVDLDALYEAVRSAKLRGAGVDVFDPEPPPSDHPILQLENVICTPHIASGTVERQYAINTAQFTNCQRVLDGHPPNDQLR